MSEFQELIKSFGKSRDYVRDFFVYGFKSRQDFTSDKKSARTYDDERRRITSWLGKYVEEETARAGSSRVKNISLMMDSNLLDENPLFAVWKTRSFTDNDAMLHFVLLDVLRDRSTSFTANEIAELLSSDYAVAVDTQMVRRKLNEYVKEGLIETEKQGKNVLYRRGETFEELLGAAAAAGQELPDTGREVKDTGREVKDVISLMQLEQPFGYVGNTILEGIDEKNEYFRVKHSFPSFTLEDEVLFQLLESAWDFRSIKLEIQNGRNEAVQIITGIPLKILISTRTGRRYVCLCQRLRSKDRKETGERQEGRYRFICLRLDQIKKITEAESESGLDKKEIRDRLERNLDYVWSVSFFGYKTKVKLTLSIDENNEEYILQRLRREGKMGTVQRLEENVFSYEKIVFDPVEMFPWLRTFIGRIMDIRFINLDKEMNETFENRKLRKDFLNDITEMERMYL